MAVRSLANYGPTLTNSCRAPAAQMGGERDALTPAHPREQGADVEALVRRARRGGRSRDASLLDGASGVARCEFLYRGGSKTGRDFPTGNLHVINGVM